ncbi:MAG: DsbA family protein [Alphaproteobacteria bacterium]|nr:DsbA family protein [Alphaproteobacteria bacterium]
MARNVVGYVVAIWLALTFGPAALAQAKQVATGDMVLGKAEAPVTVIEYASMTCPHCATFHTDILPKLKTAYIDSGKVKLIFREFPLDRIALQAAMLARCAGPARYFGFIDVLFRRQDTWSRSGDPTGALQKQALIGGMQEAEFKACMSDIKVQDLVIGMALEGEQKYKVSSTPTLLIGDKKIAPTFEDLDAAIKAALPK